MNPHVHPSEAFFMNEIPWPTLWAEKMRRNLASRGNIECANLWDDVHKAREYWKSAQKNSSRYGAIIRQIVAEKPKNILDIGSGPGCLALPLTRYGCQVTAIEPATGMITVLHENAAALGLSPIPVVQKRWEDVQVDELSGPYDTVVACYSLGMPNIETEILKMEQVCSGRVFLVWFAGITPWETVIRELWPMYHQKIYHSGPKADILFQVLYQMGIYPDVRVYEEDPVYEWETLQDLVKDYAQRLCIPEGSDLSPVESYFQKLKRSPQGAFQLKGKLTSVVISWKSRGMDPGKKDSEEILPQR